MKKSFLVTYSLRKDVNNFMRALDLFQSGEGMGMTEVFTITWKKGEKVTKKRVQNTKNNIIKALEKLGGEVFNIQII